MKTSIFNKITDHILRFLQLQLFISLISMPILLCWGLPLSILSPIGNLIFAPILTLFLLFSSLLFFTELAHIPNSFFAWALEKTTNIWLYCMNVDSHPWLFGFAQPSIWFLIGIPLLALIAIHAKILKTMLQRVIVLSLILVGSCVYIRIAYTKTHDIEKFACNRGSLHLIHENKQLIVIDPGVIGQRISAPSWIEYTLIPHLIKTSGKTTIDHLILAQPGSVLFQAIALLCEKIKVKKIYLVCWEGSFSKSEWRQFFTLKKAAQENKTIIERIEKKELALALSPKSKILITPLPNIITQKTINYPALKISCVIADKETVIYSYKYTKQPKTID